MDFWVQFLKDAEAEQDRFIQSYIPLLDKVSELAIILQNELRDFPANKSIDLSSKCVRYQKEILSEPSPKTFSSLSRLVALVCLFNRSISEISTGIFFTKKFVCQFQDKLNVFEEIYEEISGISIDMQRQSWADVLYVYHFINNSHPKLGALWLSIFGESDLWIKESDYFTKHCQRGTFLHAFKKLCKFISGNIPLKKGDIAMTKNIFNAPTQYVENTNMTVLNLGNRLDEFQKLVEELVNKLNQSNCSQETKQESGQVFTGILEEIQTPNPRQGILKALFNHLPDVIKLTESGAKILNIINNLNK